MGFRLLLLVMAVGMGLLSWTEAVSGARYNIDHCERRNFHFSRIRQPCDEFANSKFSNTVAKGKCCAVLRALHDPEQGHIQCYCQLSPMGDGIFGEIASKCALERNLQTCHG